MAGDVVYSFLSNHFLDHRSTFFVTRCGDRKAVRDVSMHLQTPLGLANLKRNDYFIIYRLYLIRVLSYQKSDNIH